MHAASKGHKRIVQVLLAESAPIDRQANNGITALFVASHMGHEEIVQVLLDAGANVGLQTVDGATAMSKAKTQRIKQLLKAAGA